ncbi:MAG: TonB-dependent receptor domain-containing protein [Bryobacteraceae bacterium]
MYSKLLRLLAAAAIAYAQDYRATLSGRITDPQRSVISGARVRVTNQATNAVNESVTNTQGLYRVPFLVPGRYSLSVEMAGFQKMARAGLDLSTGVELIVDFELPVGSVTETVNVTTEAPALNTANAELGQTLGKEIVNVLNISLTRNVTNLVQLAPGVTGGTGTYTSLAQNGFSINGGGSTRAGNEFLVDGMPSTLPSSGGLIAATPSLDNVAEVRVQSTLFDAQFGRSNGGAVSVTTKGGANQVHGSGYWFKRWTALYANTWQNNRLGLPRPPVKYDQYGYYFSGPVVLPKLFNGKDKLFFSTSLERDSEPRDLPRQARMPTAAERQGDFSQTLNLNGQALAIYDPATTVVTGTTARRSVFPGARIPAARLDPTGRAALNLLPLPNQAGVPAQLGAFNWSAAGIYTVTQRNLSTRLDWNVSPKHRLFGRFTRLWRSQESDIGWAEAFAFPGFGGTDLGLNRRWFTSVALDDTYTFSPTLIGTLRYGLSRYLSGVTNGAVGYDTSSLNLAPAISGNQAVPGIPVFNMTGSENLPGLGSSASRGADEQHNLLGTLLKQAGAHSLKFGFDYRLVRRNNNNPGGNAPGSFNFGTLFTREDPFNPRSGDTTGSVMAGFLLGLPESGNLGVNSPLSVQNHYWGFFLQEDWRVNRKLTLNFGVRYEFETPFTERYNRVSYGFDQNAAAPVTVPNVSLAGGLLFAGLNGVPRRQGTLDGNNFGPRFGLAYALNDHTVVRGGYGLFYSSQIVNSGFLGAVNTFNAVTPFIGTTDNATPASTLANPFPNGLQQPLGSAPGLRAGLGDAIEFWDTNRVSPYVQQWQFSVQRQLPWQTVIDLAYVGSHSLKQFESFNLNEVPDRFLPLGNEANRAVPNPFRGVLPATSVLGAGATITQNRLWARYPQYTTVTMHGVNTGRGLYHSMQLNLNKRLSRGLTGTFVYTFSRLMDNNTTSIVNPRFYRSVSPFDQKHVMRLAMTYELPWLFTGRHSVVRQVFGGWKLAGLYSVLSGSPLSVSHPNGRPLRVASPKLEGPVSERLGDRIVSGRPANPYFNTSAFQAFGTPFVVSPEPPTLDELRSPLTVGLNANLMKIFAIRETLKLELRLESSGVTNTPVFAAPATALNNLSTFGVINSAGGPRSMQGALRLTF